MAGREEICVTVEMERFRFENNSGDVVILAGRDESGKDVSLKGPVDGDEPKLRTPYRFFGYWGKYRGEPQFCFQSFTVSATPKGRLAIVSYLAQAPRLGRATAARIFETYGESSVEAVRERPVEVACKTPRLSKEHAREAAEWLCCNQKLEEVTIELTGLLEGSGVPKSLPREILKRWGNKGPQLIRLNPYRLMQFGGIGFKKADALYLKLKKNPRRLKRQALCCHQAIRDAGSGNTWHFHTVATHAVRASVGAVDTDPDRALKLALRGGLLSAQYTEGLNGPVDPFGDSLWVADAGQARNERRLATYVNELLAHGDATWQDAKPEGLSDHQQGRLSAAIGGRLGVLCGGPGTGKTYTVAALVKWLREHFRGINVAVAAPTGKAAVRCSEAMHEYGAGVTARTIHSLLGVEVKDTGGWRFVHGPGAPMEADVYILDESSMVDTDLACSFFSALPADAHVLLVGDTNQLLPVGHGAPLRDLIAAGVPCGELTEVRRNSGAIVEACHAIRREERFTTGNNLHCWSDDVVSAVRIAEAEWVFDPVRDVQVVVAVNDKSPLSRRKLNRELQAELTTAEPQQGTPFRLADKVVCLKNSWFQYRGKPGPNAILRDDQVYVANGEIGYVREFVKGRMAVELSSPDRTVLVPLGKVNETDDTGCNWDLAYALSVHKSQGSEFPCVIVVMDDSGAANRVGDRAWVYTAISRAKQQCVLLGPIALAHKWCRRNRIDDRKTFLRELVRP